MNSHRLVKLTSLRIESFCFQPRSRDLRRSLYPSIATAFRSTHSFDAIRVHVHQLV